MVSTFSDAKIVGRILRAVRDARCQLNDGEDKAALLKQIAETVHQEWELRNSPVASYIHPRSVRARALPHRSIIDHPYPATLFAADLLSLPEEDLRINYIEYLLWNKAGFAWITEDESDRIRKAELHDRMPPNWDGFDNYARFLSCGIYLGEAGVMSRQEIEGVLQNPYMKYYVYLLSDPKDKVFYVGKGEGKRILSHESEVYRPRFPVHTNWKKLNIIAQIILSGKVVRYFIDSWHADATSALVREERLILKYEKEDPRRICNSNGERWRGRPSKALANLREQAKLETPNMH